MEQSKITLENLVRLDPNKRDYYKLAEGRLLLLDHPEKGMVWTDTNNVYVNTIELTEEEKLRFR